MLLLFLVLCQALPQITHISAAEIAILQPWSGPLVQIVRPCWVPERLQGHGKLWHSLWFQVCRDQSWWCFDKRVLLILSFRPYSRILRGSNSSGKKKKNKKGSLPLSSPVSSVETFTGYVLDSSPVVSTWVEMYREEESVSPNPKGAHRCAEEKNYNSAWRFSCAQVPGVPGRSTEHLEYDSHALTFYPELAASSSPCYF